MIAWRVVKLACVVALIAEAKIVKSDILNICDPVYNVTSKVQCYCDKDFRERSVIKSAECYITKEDVNEDDDSWDRFEDLSKTTRLTLTNTRGIALKYIPSKALKHATKILKLDIKYGKINEVLPFAFCNLSNVEEISLRDNQIEKLDQNSFAHHKALTTISLDKNYITEINRNVFVDLPSLEKLYLTSNKITTIHDKAFVHLASLRELEIDRNSLFSLNNETFVGLKKLTKLDLSGNGLELIGDNTFAPLMNLQSLNLEGNKLQMFDDMAFKGLGKLQSLSLARNKLVILENAKLFEGLNSLVSLSLRGNQIRELKDVVMAPILNNFYAVSSSLDVEDNNFPCDCRLEWFVSLMNKTLNSHLKLSIENLKCVPDNELRELWMKNVDAEKAQSSDNGETQGQAADYEYYDDTQLNGKLFYIDIRDLLTCGKKSKLSYSEIRNIQSVPEFKTSPRSVSKEVISQVANNEISTEKKHPYTTSRLATVSAKPDERKPSFEHGMASDEAKPDKLKAHRSILEDNVAPSMTSADANRSLSCTVVIIILSYFLL